MTTTRIEELSFDSADKFVEEIRLTSPRWGESSWLFRGHWNADWKLRPTAYRPEAWRRFGGLPEDYDEETGIDSTDFKELLVFAQGLDRHGIRIPGATRSRIDYLMHATLRPREWIEELADLVALAQHYGFPTRLLDFTYQSYVAAYFAAVESAEARSAPNGKLCIWAIDTSVFNWSEQSPDWFKLVSATRAGNGSLVAQDGAFVVWEESRLTLDDLLAMTDPDPWREFRDVGHVPAGPTARKLTLPQAEAPKLLGLLARERITGARLFPGPLGVIRERIEQAHHKIHPADRNYSAPPLDIRRTVE